MVGKGTSEHERITALEDLFGHLRSDLDAVARLGEAAARSWFTGPQMAPFMPVTALRPDLVGLLPLAASAIVPLPRTVAQGQGKSPCAGAGSSTHVYTVGANANLVFVVENNGACGTVQIQLKRGAGIVGQSPQVNKGNTGAVGPVAAQKDDIAEVVCAGGGPAGAQKCEFTWQVNLGA